MAFWKGIEKIYSGITEIASTPGEVWEEAKLKRRANLSGQYNITMSASMAEYATGESQEIKLKFTYDGAYNKIRLEVVQDKEGAHYQSGEDEDLDYFRTCASCASHWMLEFLKQHKCSDESNWGPDVFAPGGAYEKHYPNFGTKDFPKEVYFP
jgi:hypothetical protein